MATNLTAAYRRAVEERTAAEHRAAAAWADVEAAENLLAEARKLAYMYDRQLSSRKAEQAAAVRALDRAGLER